MSRADDNVSHQLPSSMVAQEFGEINVRRSGGQIEVNFTVLMEPQGSGAEGWQTGVALDASASMKSWYGRGFDGKIPPEVQADYLRKGWMEEKLTDGRRVASFHGAARKDAIAKGYLRQTANQIEPLAREFIAYLAGNLDADGGTTVLYWACGDGTAFEVAGDFTAQECTTLALAGPRQVAFGNGTQLKPALHYFVERFKDAPRAMYVFLTDGRLDDLAAVKAYTTKLARAIAAGKQNSVKCVLIGIGEQIDEGQMEELDDLDTGTEVDIWDHKIAKEMRGLVEIFAEVVDENQIVAPTAHIYDSKGKVVKAFTDGFPAKGSFTMPADSPWFELEVGGERIRQSVIVKSS